jgi:hypothetical protein
MSCGAPSTGVPHGVPLKGPFAGGSDRRSVGRSEIPPGGCSQRREAPQSAGDPVAIVGLWVGGRWVSGLMGERV